MFKTLYHLSLLSPIPLICYLLFNLKNKFIYLLPSSSEGVSYSPTPHPFRTFYLGTFSSKIRAKISKKIKKASRQYNVNATESH